jgi:hypothetical protein
MGAISCMGDITGLIGKSFSMRSWGIVRLGFGQLANIWIKVILEI